MYLMSESVNQSQSRQGMLRNMLLGLVPGLVIDAALPYVIYVLLSPHIGELNALIASSVPPLMSNIVSLVRTRKIDAFGLLIFLGIVVSIIAVFIGGDPRILLVRESLVTGMMGIVCLVSLLFPKPFMYYLGQHFSPIRFSDYWQYSGFRRYMYLITGAWGIFFIGEFLLKVLLVYTLPVATAVGVTPIVFYASLTLMIAWTMHYSQSVRKQNQRTTQALSQQ
jgi:hypothetical protein